MVILLFSIYACTPKNSNFGITTSNIIISGKIRNINNHKDHQTIQIICRDFFERQKQYSSKIDENGFFRISFPSVCPQEFYLKFGSLLSVFCHPGDSLFVEIDSDILNDIENKYPNGVYYCKFPENELGKTNQQINKFKEDLPNEKYSYMKADEAEKNKEPDDYKKYIQQRGNEYSTFLKSFISNNKTTSLFNRWANVHLKYESMKDLMRYRWTHPEYNQRDTFHLPNDYFSFLNDYNMDDNDLFTLSHFDFLHELSIYSMQTPNDSLEKAIIAIKKKEISRGVDIYKNMIKINSNGFTRELFLTKFYVDILKGQQLDIFEAVYDSSFTQQHFFLNVINTEYSNLKKYLSNQNTDAANLISLKSTVTNNLIDSLIQKYGDKVIYIDFWAPWCSPCMAEMPFSKDMQTHFINKDVVFLFLANQCKEDSWRATIANKKITGEHLLLTDDQYNVFSSSLGIKGIPHYSLIDKRGKIVMKDAPRPSDRDRLIQEIEKLLTNNAP
jgi:thiol-disulfide isomerase/thioredoxin